MIERISLGCGEKRSLGRTVCSVAWLAGIVFAATSATQASSVVPMTFARIADYSGQVIVGEVGTARSYWAANPKRIETEVVLRNVEYLKGKRTDSTDSFTLIVPGGQVGDVGQRICCAPDFKPGEKWVLCLLQTYKTFPVVGLWQGAFRVVSDRQGIERVQDASGRPVVGMDDEGFVLSLSAGREHTPQPIGAEHVSIAPVAPGRTAEEGMNYSAFVETIRPILDRSKVVELNSPAGRRETVHHTAVPLKSAGTAVNKETPRSANESVKQDSSRDGEKRETPRQAQPSTTPTEGRR